ncbi:root meristem growth factor 10-like [Salvia miltiorrhiza]|uniref:root meristem growth factor 10-like n=1 Tax=Salvia miltiorrhiza TaxID=226208 RepID=UPI0025AD243A|nr:root meristem growth factor 10-like [Salvia miltiorrhiza]
MSTIIALLFLFLSLHSCNATVIAVANNDPTEEFLHYSITKVNGGEGRRVLREKSESLNHVGKDSISKRTFRVPQNKRGEDEEVAGFNLDYLPPKTHPPSHN